MQIYSGLELNGYVIGNCIYGADGNTNSVIYEARNVNDSEVRYVFKYVPKERKFGQYSPTEDILECNPGIHIVREFGFVKLEKGWGCFMDYFPEGTLADYLEQQSRLDEDEIRSLLGGILEVLEKMHNMNWVHRDVKLENILVFRDQNGHLVTYLADFDFCQQLVDGDKFYDHSCTRGYEAPEIFNPNIGGDRKVDIWAFGVCCYIAFTGVAPFKDHNKCRYNRFEEDYTYNNDPLSSLGASEEFCEVLKRCLDYESESRYEASQVRALPFFSRRLP